MSEAVPTRERLAAGDAIRVIATIAVVLQHVAHAAYHRPEVVSAREWISAVSVVSSTEWAVPVFVMLSGALLLAPRQETLRSFYRRRFSRVGVPLLFWSAVYLAGLGLTGDDRDLWPLVDRLLGGRPYYHLFFLFVITGLYAITPMLRTWAAAARPEEVRLAVWLALAIAAGASMLGARGGTALTRFIPYVGYFVAGWAMREGILRLPVSFGTALLAAAGLAAATVAIGTSHGLLPTYLHDYLSVFLIPMSLAVFAALLARAWATPETSRFARLCATLSPLTLGIYLIHPALLKIFTSIGIHATRSPVELSIPLIALVVFALSGAIAWGMSRVRPLAVLIGL